VGRPSSRLRSKDLLEMTKEAATGEIMVSATTPWRPDGNFGAGQDGQSIASVGGTGMQLCKR
jgi:hypothetical protein